jgi:thioesterase domain-containing protein
MVRNTLGAIATAQSYIVPFRTSGAGSPLFCFPGCGGNVNVFRDMIGALPEGHPVFAVDLEWLCETEQEFTIEELATVCLEVIRKSQKSGPYYFCGYSFGGLVAYEIAMQLSIEGERTSLVALLDAPNPALRSNLSAADSAQFRKTYLSDRLKKYAYRLVRGELQAFINSALAFVVSRAGRVLIPSIKRGFRMMNRPLPGTLRSNDPGFLRAWHSYVPKRYPGSVICFRVEQRGPEYGRDSSMGWDACATGGVQVYVVPGGHVDMMQMPSVVDMMKMPSVQTIADILATYLDRGSNPDGEPVAGRPHKVESRGPATSFDHG